MENSIKLSVGSQLYRDLKDKVNRKVFRRFHMPWMKSKEMDIIDEVLNKLKPKNCLEWGSGYSTLLFPGRLPELNVWHSIEHNKEWYELLKDQITNQKVTLTFVEPDNKNYNSAGPYNESSEGIYKDFETYINYPQRYNLKFDFVFIDGRSRKNCLRKAFELLNDDGVIIVHDANRVDYFSELPAFGSIFHLTDYRKDKLRGGIWVGAKKDINKYLDTDHHEALWKQHDRIAKALFLR